MCQIVMREEGQRGRRKVCVLSGNGKYFQNSIVVTTLLLSIDFKFPSTVILHKINTTRFLRLVMTVTICWPEFYGILYLAVVYFSYYVASNVIESVKTWTTSSIRYIISKSNPRLRDLLSRKYQFLPYFNNIIMVNCNP